MIGPLLGAGKFEEAIQYAYENLRCNQGDEVAHGRYMWIFMQYASRNDLQFQFPEVAPECTVHYRENDGVPKSVIVTSDLGDKRFDGEISPDSELAKAIMSAKAGDEVKLSPQSLQPRVITIEEVLSKYVYRYQQVLQNFQLNFPHANTIQMLKVMDGDELDISLFKKSLEERRKHIDFAVDLFKHNPLPISALATWLGIEYQEAFEFLTTNPDIGIRCSQIDANGPRSIKISELDHKSKSLVLDQSAVLTIENLELWERLKSFQLVVMRSVADLFESHLEELEDDRSKGTMMLTDNDQLILHEPSDEERKGRVSRATALVENIRKNCRIEESLAAASVNSELREAFGRVHAYPSLDSIAYAQSDANLVLWTDEIFMQAVARNDFKISSIGVQSILRYLRANGVISHSELDTLTAKLLGWHYKPIEWNSDVAFAAAKLSKWDADCQPFKEVLRQFSGNHWKLRNKCQMALELFVKVYRSNANNFSETHLLLRVMDSIGQRKAADLIRSDAFAACMPNQAMLDSISLSLDIWQERWLGK